jgi:hypothetical protein
MTRKPSLTKPKKGLNVTFNAAAVTHNREPITHTV